MQVVVFSFTPWEMITLNNVQSIDYRLNKFYITDENDTHIYDARKCRLMISEVN